MIKKFPEFRNILGTTLLPVTLNGKGELRILGKKSKKWEKIDHLITDSLWGPIPGSGLPSEKKFQQKSFDSQNRKREPG